MKPTTSWSYRPYRPPLYPYGDIAIVRLAPAENSITIDWLTEGEKEFEVLWRKRGTEKFSSLPTKTATCTIEGLENETEYELKVISGIKESRIRLARTDKSVGTVVNYLHPEDGAYSFSGHALCSPSLVRLENGTLLASMDVFQGGAPQNLTLIFSSQDQGKTWTYLTDLYPCFWGRMFLHNGKLYMLSCSTEYGDLLIGCSEDGGKTFGTPSVLLRGSCHCKVAGVHKNPQPPLVYGGRLWTTLEWGCWAEGYHAAMVGSAPADSDLLDPASWLFSDPVRYHPDWKGVAKGESTGNIEGTLAVLPDGNLYNIMRYDTSHCVPRFGMVLAYRINTVEPEAAITYDHPIALPGNLSKFMIRKDETTGTYYTIISRITDETAPHARNLLSLMKSSDCDHWILVKDLLDYRKDDPQKTGFQYVDFFIDGEDLLWLCRTAINGAANFHDANYSTFHVLKNFRSITPCASLSEAPSFVHTAVPEREGLC